MNGKRWSGSEFRVFPTRTPPLLSIGYRCDCVASSLLTLLKTPLGQYEPDKRVRMIEDTEQIDAEGRAAQFSAQHVHPQAATWSSY